MTASGAQQRIADTASKADALSLKLYHLTEIVRLAAFAAEARRTLSDSLTFNNTSGPTLFAATTGPK